MITLEQCARMDAVTSLADEIVIASLDVLRKHGPDPEISVILASGIVEAIIRINDNVQPRFREAIIAALGGIPK